MGWSSCLQADALTLQLDEMFFYVPGASLCVHGDANTSLLSCNCLSTFSRGRKKQKKAASPHTFDSVLHRLHLTHFFHASPFESFDSAAFSTTTAFTMLEL